MHFRFIDPATDFSDGLRVLHVYHDDFLARGRGLLKLVDTLHKEGMSEATAYQCIEFHNYYTRANKLHHQDEEHALFPALVNRSFLIDGMIERLTLDHEEIEAAWDELSPLLASPERITTAGKLKRLAEEFEKIQCEHLVRENEDFLQRVATELHGDERAEIGRKMAMLRGLEGGEIKQPHEHYIVGGGAL